jgi:GNAT superfamily N-acetyltransferase
MPFTFNPLNQEAARQVLAWTYPPPYNVYNEDPERLEQVVVEVLRPDYHYYSIAEDEDPLVAYCCYGLDARVAGGDYALDALDIGLMVRPDLNGQGRGTLFAAAVVDFARRTFPDRRWRVTIASFNLRAQCVWREVGFRKSETFLRRGDGLSFSVWVRDDNGDDRPPARVRSWKGKAGRRITSPTNRI